MVHNWPLLPFQAYLSPIQKDWSACSSASCGQNLDFCSLSTNGAPCSWIDFPALGLSSLLKLIAHF